MSQTHPHRLHLHPLHRAAAAHTLRPRLLTAHRCPLRYRCQTRCHRLRNLLLRAPQFRHRGLSSKRYRYRGRYRHR